MIFYSIKSPFNNRMLVKIVGPIPWYPDFTLKSRELELMHFYSIPINGFASSSMSNLIVLLVNVVVEIICTTQKD